MPTLFTASYLWTSTSPYSLGNTLGRSVSVCCVCGSLGVWSVECVCVCVCIEKSVVFVCVECVCVCIENVK